MYSVLRTAFGLEFIIDLCHCGLQSKEYSGVGIVEIVLAIFWRSCFSLMRYEWRTEKTWSRRIHYQIDCTESSKTYLRLPVVVYLVLEGGLKWSPHVFNGQNN